MDAPTSTIFWTNLVQYIKNCQLKVKFGTLTTSNMQNSMMMFIFSVFNQKYPFWAKLVQKNQNCQFKMKHGSQTNSNIQNSMMVSFYLFQTRNIFFREIQSKKSKLPVYPETWHLDQFKCVQFNGDIHFFSNQNSPFWANLVKKIKIVSLILTLLPRLIRICRTQWWCSHFQFYTSNSLFYCLCDRTGVETLKKAAVNTAFLF